jgi:NTE family protein
VHRVQRALAALLHRLPADLEENDDLKILKSVASDKVYNIIHLIYRAQNYEGHSKDHEFSRLSMQDHWRAGYHDAVRTTISNATVVNEYKSMLNTGRN